MKTTRYATTRQKACQNCSAAKAKCDRQPACCSRCSLRGLSCTYPQVPPQPGPSPVDNRSPSPCQITRNSLPSSPSRGPSWLIGPGQDGSQFDELPETLTEVHSQEGCETKLGVNSSTPTSLETLDFSGLELAIPINADDIKNRWLNSYVPIPGQKSKEYPANVGIFIYRMLKSYTADAMYGRGSHPFIHSSQLAATRMALPLSTCLNLVRICEKPLPGSEIAVADMVQQEMRGIYNQREMYDDFTLLGAFQSYLIYSMVLFFRFGKTSNPFLREAVMNLQDLACSTSRQGVMCVAEQHHIRPSWEAWIVTEAKRRTIYVMYLFDNLLSTHEGLTTFLGAELQGLPAPSNKTLWRAQTRSEWKVAYNVHLGKWPQGSLRIDELWAVPESVNQSGLAERHRRVDQWLEDIDEFGTMLYAVTCCTHGT